VLGVGRFWELLLGFCRCGELLLAGGSFFVSAFFLSAALRSLRFACVLGPLLLFFTPSTVRWFPRFFFLGGIVCFFA
jgi:hypothetical protein